MAEHGSPATALQELISCPICLETFQEPLTLPCFHTFCGKCLKSHVEASRRARSESEGKLYLCPTCRKEHTIPDGGLDKMTVNFFVNNIIEVHRSLAGGSDVCDSCDEAGDSSCGGVEWRCIDCAMSMCHAAKSAHDRMKRVMKNHTVITAEEWRKKDTADLIKQSKEKCVKHQDEYLKFYCATCEVAICRDCHILSHAEHKCRELSEVADEAQGGLRGVLAGLRNSLDGVDSALRHLNQTRDALINSHEKVIKDMEDHKVSAIAAITEYFDRLRIRVDEHFSHGQKSVQVTIDEYQTELSCLQSACDHGTNIIKYGRSGEKVNTLKHLSKLVTDTQRTDIDQVNKKLSLNTIKFNPGDTSSIKSSVIFGDLEEISLYHHTNTAAEGLVDVQTVAPPVRQYVNPPQLVANFSVDVWPWSVAVTSRGDILVAGYGDNKVSVYSADRKKQKDLLRPPSVKKWSPRYVSATADSDQLVVVNCEKAADSGGLFVYDHSLRRISSVTVDRPYRAAVTGDGDIAVLRRDDQRRGWLELYDPQTRRMTASTQAGDTLSNPYHVTVSRATRDLIVTHDGGVTAFTRQLTPRCEAGEHGTAFTRQLTPRCEPGEHGTAFTRQLTPRWSYARRGRGEHGELVSPLGVCVDGDGRVLVSDLNTRRVIVLSGEGEYVTHLHTDQLIQSRPYGLTLTASGQLVVGTSDNKVYIIKCLN